ncbi:hypothetical protein STSP_49160 [Streptomyces jeddahensis]|uniref:Uncharacterized protein n=1 Tax=Streptomyces jeddahensis TaxID=1716141 RepID=A0A177HMV5_9ACTN|nr:hypothetical protein STSP_49160 [Streptomyces jeddahensis]
MQELTEHGRRIRTGPDTIGKYSCLRVIETLSDG